MPAQLVANAMERYERLIVANPETDAVGATVNTLLYANKRPKGTLVAPLPLQIEEGKVAVLEGLLPPVTARRTHPDERVLARHEPPSSQKTLQFTGYIREAKLGVQRVQHKMLPSFKPPEEIVEANISTTVPVDRIALSHERTSLMPVANTCACIHR